MYKSQKFITIVAAHGLAEHFRKSNSTVLSEPARKCFLFFSPKEVVLFERSEFNYFFRAEKKKIIFLAGGVVVLDFFTNISYAFWGEYA